MESGKNPVKRSYFLTLNFNTFLCKKQGFFAVIHYKKENRRNGADLVKLQFIGLFAPQVLLALPLGELAKIGYSEPIFD